MPPRLCAATAGPTLVAAVGLDDDELLEGAWDQLEAEYRTVGASAQKRALEHVGRIVGGMEPDVRRTYGLRQAADLDEGWAWMKEAMGSLAKARLYAPNPADPELGEFDPTSRTPTGLVRQAMRVAGGVKGSANAAQLHTSGEGSAWITTPDGSSPGGIATGELIGQILRDEGGAIQGWKWVYGPADRKRTFHPHLELDGFVFASFTDPRLVITGGWPTTGHYIPGDHKGCVCDYEPVVLSAEQVQAMQAEGRLPTYKAPKLPEAPAEPAAPEAPAEPDWGPLGRPLQGTSGYRDIAARLRGVTRTGQGRSFAFDGGDIEGLDVHMAPVRVRRTASADLADAVEYRFKLTEGGRERWQRQLLGDADYSANMTRRSGGWSEGSWESYDTDARSAAWKRKKWSVTQEARVPEPGIASTQGGTSELQLSKAAELRGDGSDLRWRSPDDTMQARWSGTVEGRQVNVQYTDSAISDGGSPNALHNEVRVWVQRHGPDDVPDDAYFAALMRELGFTQHVAAPTPEQALDYARNSLLTRLGGSAASRAADDGVAALARIRAQYGIGPEDVQVVTGANGRTVARLPESALQRLVADTDVTFFKHNLSHGVRSNPEVLADMLSGEQGGLMASTRRMNDGIPFGGMSTHADYGTGGADYVFTRQQRGPTASNRMAGHGQLTFSNRRLQDLDWYAYTGDRYGATGSTYRSADFVAELRGGAANGWGSNQETMFRDVLDFEYLQAIHLDSGTRTRVLELLEQRGVTTIGGRPIEDVVRLAGGDAPDLLPEVVPGKPLPPMHGGGAQAATPPPPLGAAPGAPLAAPATKAEANVILDSATVVDAIKLQKMGAGSGAMLDTIEDSLSAMGDGLEVAELLAALKAEPLMLDQEGQKLIEYLAQQQLSDYLFEAVMGFPKPPF